VIDAKYQPINVNVTADNSLRQPLGAPVRVGLDLTASRAGDLYTLLLPARA